MPNFQRIIDIVSEAFSVLDFSHIISGTATYLIITLYLHLHQIHLEMVNLTWTIICHVILAYLCGILSWSIGRSLRKVTQNVSQDFEFEMKSLINFNDESEPDKITLPADLVRFSPTHLYTYMWIELSKVSKERTSFINRFWVIQAMCEGLITSCVFAMTFMGLWLLPNTWYLWLALAGSILILLGFICQLMITARENARYQIREVVLGYYSYCIPHNRA